MIVLALSFAAMLVVASLTGRFLARARELYSFEFIPLDDSTTPNNRVSAALRRRSVSARLSLPETRRVALIPNEVIVADTACSAN